MSLSPRSMAAMWLAGFEERPEDAGELCVVEVFGRSIEDGSAEIGVGVKQVNDPRLTHDFVAPRLAIDVADYHTYEVQWDDARAAFLVDGAQAHICSNPPTYPMQVMVAVFDFPGWSDRDDHVPSLTVDWVEGST
jgi:beta-glucanase (GH16 family)